MASEPVGLPIAGESKQAEIVPSIAPSPRKIYLVGPSDHPSIPIADLEAIALAKWTKISDHLTMYWHDPDPQACHTMIAAVAAHHNPFTQAVWLMLVGPSGSGKTSYGIQPLTHLPECYSFSTITPHTFLSGYIGQDNPSFLHQHRYPCVLWKDLTSYLSSREDERKVVGGQMREMADGYLDMGKGTGNHLHWDGKATMIAACTPVIERYHSVMRDMGERWHYLRWLRGDGLAIGAKARKQIGQEAKIDAELARLVYDYFTFSKIAYNKMPVMAEPLAVRIDAMAEIIAYGRYQLLRNKKGEICDVAQPEQATRSVKALYNLTTHTVALQRRSIITSDDLKLAARITFNSIPLSRTIILTQIPVDDVISEEDILTKTKLPRSTVDYVTEELCAIGMLEVEEVMTAKCFKFTEKMRELWKIAFPV